MMEREGLYLSGHDLYLSSWDSTFRAYRQDKVSQIFKQYLLTPCSLNKVYLKDIFMFIENDVNFWNDLLGFDLEPFINEIKKTSSNTTPEDNFCRVDYLELSNRFETKRKIKQEEVSIQNNTSKLDFRGIGKVKQGKRWRKDQRISVSMTPLNEIAHLEIKINPKAQLDIIEKYRVKESIGFFYNPNLIDIIDAVIYELSFYGPPEERNSVKNSLMDQIESIKSNLPK